MYLARIFVMSLVVSMVVPMNMGLVFAEPQIQSNQKEQQQIVQKLETSLHNNISNHGKQVSKQFITLPPTLVNSITVKTGNIDLSNTDKIQFPKLDAKIIPNLFLSIFQSGKQSFDLGSNLFGLLYEMTSMTSIFPNAYADYASSIGSAGSGQGQFNNPIAIALDNSGSIYVADYGNNRIEEFNSAGVYKSQFGSSGSGNGQFSTPREITIDNSGNIYVADFGNNRVQKFNSAGVYQSQLGCATGACSASSTPGQFHGPYGIVINSTGYIYVTDLLNNRIELFNSTGAYVSQFGSSGSGNSQFSSPSGMVIDSSGNIYVVDSNNNRVEKFNSAGTYLSQFGSLGSGNGQFNTPTNVALDSLGNIYVVDYNNNRIDEFNSAGAYVSQFGSLGSGNGQFNNPYGVALDSSGNIYVADFGNNRIQKFSPSVNYQSQFGSTGTGSRQFNHPNGMTIDSLGNIYVADQSNNRIQKFDSSGDFLLTFGSSGSGNGQFDGPQGVTIDSSGNIYVVDGNNRVQKFNSVGTYLSQFGSAGSGNGQFGNPNGPTGITLDSSGNLYVVDYNNNRIQKFNSAGVYQSQFGSAGSGNGQFNQPFGIVLDSSGNIYVTDNGNNRVEKFNSAGVYQSQFGSSGSGNGQFSGPADIEIDSSGNIYVTDNGNNRVEKFNSAGVYQSQFGSSGSGNGQFSSPIGIKLDKSGNLYVADSNNNRVEKFSPFITPTFISQFGSLGSGNGQFHVPQGIVLDSSGNIYVVDDVNSRIEKFNSAGTFLSQFGSFGSGSGQFNNPFDVALDNSGNIYVTDTLNSRIEKFDSSGNYLLQFGSFGSGNGQFKGPNFIALDSSGNVYVADSGGNDRIEKFDSSGNYLSQFGSTGSGNGQFNSPEGIALDSSGNIYVADYNNNRIEKFNSAGTYLSQFGSAGSGTGQFSNPEGITLDSLGNIYVTDVGNSRVEEFNSAGAYQLQFGSSGSGNGQFNTPHGITVDISRNVYVVDSNNHRVEKFSPPVSYQSQFGSLGSTNGQFSSPQHVALDSSGNIYVVDDNGNRVEKFNSAGTYLSQIGCATGACSSGSGNGQLNGPIDMAIDSSGNIYVGDHNNGRIEKFDSSGNYVSQFGSQGSGNGQLNLPTGIAIDSSGNIYVAENTNNRVSKFNSAGVYQSQFGSSGSGNGQFNDPQGIAIDSSGNIYVADYGNNRVQIFNSAGVYQSQLGSSGSGNGQFQSPVDITFDTSGNIYVADAGNNRVEVFNSAGVYQSQFGSAGSGNGQFSGDTSIVVDNSGTIYVNDIGNNRVQKFIQPIDNHPPAISITSPTNTQLFTTSTVSISGTAADLGDALQNIKVSIDGGPYLIANGTTSWSFTASGLSNGVHNINAKATDSVGNTAITTAPFTTAQSASLVIGAPNFTSYGSGIHANTLYGPFDLTFDSSGNMWVVDCCAASRILEYTAPFTTGQNASLVIGQTDFTSSVRGTTASNLNYPIGLAFDHSGNLWVTETLNHRVLEFTAPFTTGQNASLVIGQTDFTSSSSGTSASKFTSPSNPTFDSSGNLWIEDGNRVLEFTTPFSTGQSASFVIGQTDFTSNGIGTTASKLHGPFGLAFDNVGNMWVGDEGNNRILKFTVPFTTGQNASLVIGQTDFTSSSSGTSASKLNAPENRFAFDPSGNLWVSDYGNNRILKFPAPFSTAESASIVIGQTNFTSSACPSVGSATLCDPEGVTFDSSGNMWIQDSGNSRILEYTSSFTVALSSSYTVSLSESLSMTDSISTNKQSPNPHTFVTGQPATTFLGSTPSSFFAYGFDTPISETFDSSGNLWVVDKQNSRILEYKSPFTLGESPSVVLGQPNLSSISSGVSANTLFYPTGIAFDSSGNLWVADRHSNRILKFPQANLVTGGAATVVLGQTDFTSSSSGTSATKLSGPYALAFDSSGNLWATDFSNNRVLQYPQANLVTGGAATVALGQPNLTTSSSESTATSLYAPTGLSFDSSGNLWVVDSGNNRVIKYPQANLVTGGSATIVLGQTNLNNNFSGTTATSLHAPNGLSFDSSGNLWVVDYFNNRVLKFPQANLATGGAATVALGQTSLTTNSYNTTSTTIHGPEDLRFDSSGNLWVVDSNNDRIIKYPQANLVTGGAATLVLGQSDLISSMTLSVPATATTQLYPEGNVFDSSGNLWVIDNGNNRILEYPKSNLVTGGAATVVLGQPDFISYSFNASSTSLYNPNDLAFDSSGNLWVADSNNNRVLEYPASHLVTGGAATVVLGQTDFSSNSSNSTSTSFLLPIGLAFDSSGNLWVTDFGNNRILKFPQANLVTGGAATVVLGQTDFTSSSSGTSATKLHSPIKPVFDSTGNLWVADETNHRILKFPQANLVTGGAATVVLGQPDFTTHSSGSTATTLSFPDYVNIDSSGNLWVIDSGNNRVLKYPQANLATGGAATVALGQTSLTTSSYAATATSLSGPGGLAFDSSGNLWVADSGNNRVSEFPTISSTSSVISTNLSAGPNVISLGKFTTQFKAPAPAFVNTNFALVDTSINPETSAPSGTVVGHFFHVETDSPDIISSRNVTISYSTSDLGSLDPATLKIYRFSGGAWTALSSSLDIVNKKVTATAPGFSTFVLVSNSLTTLGFVTGQPATTFLGSTPSTLYASGLSYPQANAFDSSNNLWVVDGNRILEFKSPFSTDESASVTLGQPNLSTNSSGTTATTLNYPTGLAFDSSGNLWVADNNNNRVLKYPQANLVTGGAATVVLGQTSFTTSSSGTTATTLNMPSSLAFDSSGNLWVADEFNHRILKYPQANLVTGGTATVVLGQTSLTASSSGTTATSLSEPYGLAFDSSGNLWVSDRLNSRVVEYPISHLVTGGAATVALGQTNLSSGSTGTTSTKLDNPDSLAFDSSGNLWVVDETNNRVVEYPPSHLVTGGAATVALGQTNLSSGSTGTTTATLNVPTGLVFDISGNLWVTDSSNNRVIKYPQANLVTGGAATLVLGHPDFLSSQYYQPATTTTGLNNPSADAFDSSGNLWVADDNNNRVLEYPKSNLVTGGAATVVLGQTNFTSSANGTSATTLRHPIALTFDGSGNLWVAECGNNRVIKYPQANFVTGGAATMVIGQPDFVSYTPGNTATKLNCPISVKFDSSGNLWVADENNHRVLKFPSANLVTGGAATVVLGQTSLNANSFGTSDTTLYYPTDLAFDSSGNLWVTDAANSRVLKYPQANLVTGGAATVALGQNNLFSGFFGAVNATTINFPNSLAFDGSGNLWVAASNARVLKYPQANLVTGGAATVALGQSSLTFSNNGTSSATGLGSPYYLTFDSSGNLWVVDGPNNRVSEFPTVSSTSTMIATTLSAGTNTISLGKFTTQFHAPTPAFAQTNIAVLDTLTNPETTSPSGTVVGHYFHVETDSPDIISSRNVTISYSTSDLGSVDPTTIQIYRYSGGAWTALSSTVDTVNKIVTATAPGFSTFVLASSQTAHTNNVAGPSITSLIAFDGTGTNAGYGSGLTITATFSTGTNQPPVATKSQLDSIFVYSQNLGANYTGQWTTPATLVITIQDPTGATATIGGLALTVKSSANLLNVAGTSNPSTSQSPTLTGSFGAKAGPFITGLVVNDPSGLNPSYAAGDTLTILFSEPTNEPLGTSVLNKGSTDSLFTFSQTLSTNSNGYTGQWIDASTFKITINNISGNTNPQIGTTTVSVNAGAHLKNSVGTSRDSTSTSPVMSGHFGNSPGPSIVYLVASQGTGPGGVYSAGNTITIKFSAPTNMYDPTPLVAGLSKSDLTNMFTFSQSLGTNPNAFSGQWVDPSTIVITILDTTGSAPPTIGGLTVTAISGIKDASGTSASSTSTSPALSGSFGSIQGPTITSLVAANPTVNSAVYYAGNTITVTFDQATNRPGGTAIQNKQAVDALFSFSQVLGTSSTAYTGQWVDPATFVMTILDTTGSTPPTIGGLQTTVIGNIKNAAGTSLASTSISPLLSGSFGNRPGPFIISLIASDPTGTHGVYSNGITITAKFSESTNEPGGTSVQNKASVDSLFAFSQNLGTNYNGQWVDPSTFVITILDATGAQPPTVGGLTFTIKSGANLKNAPQISLASISSSPVLSGSFGSHQGPSITNLIADDPTGTHNSYANGITISVIFSEPTNKPGGTIIQNKAAVDNLFTFSQNLGNDYTGQWTSPSVFVITIQDSSNSTPPTIGVLSASVNLGANLQNAAVTSLASTSVSSLLTGTFGTFTVSIPVTAGGSAVTTLPSGIITTLTLPQGSEGTIQITKSSLDTNQATGGASLNFLGNVANITPQSGASCNLGCGISFTFTQADADSYGISPFAVKVYHDANEDGIFESNEALSTTVTQTSQSTFLASANVPFNSKFAIGGVVTALAVLGVHGGDSASSQAFSAQGFLYLKSLSSSAQDGIRNENPYVPLTPSNDPTVPYFPFSLDGNNYLIARYANTIQTVTEKIGVPVNLQLASPDITISHVALYTNMEGLSKEIGDSDTYIVYDKGSPLQIVDPHGYFSNVQIKTTTDNNGIEKFGFSITFAKPMPKSNIFVREWDEAKYSSDTKIKDAIQIIESPQNTQTSKDVVSNTIASQTVSSIPSTPTDDVTNYVKQWAGYSSTSISDSELLGHVGIKGNHIPSWFMKSSKWLVSGDTSPQEFKEAIKYLSEKGVIK